LTHKSINPINPINLINLINQSPMYFSFAWRYFKAKKSTNAINIIAWISVAAIAVGTVALILVLSVFNGFEGLVKSLYSSFYTDLKISPPRGKTIFLDSLQIQKIRNTPGVKSMSLVAEEKALMQNGDQQSAIVFLKGVDSHYTEVAGVQGKMVRGNFDLGTAEQPRAVMGVAIESALGVQSDRSIFPLTAYLPKKLNTLNNEQSQTISNSSLSNPEESLSGGNLVPSGSFAIQQDFDNKYVLTNIDFVKAQLGLARNEFSGAEISLNIAGKEDEVKKDIEKILGNNYLVQTRYEQNRSLYSVMQLEKWAIYAILSLILVVAAFNMIGALTMLVLEKNKDIQVLQAMGADRNWIRKVFLSEGLLLALVGSGLGIILALILAWLQVKYKLIPLEASSFVIDYYPVKLSPADFLLVLVTVVIIAVIASWYPANKAAKQPFELRN